MPDKHQKLYAKCLNKVFSYQKEYKQKIEEMTILLKILFTVHLLFFYCSLTSGQQTTIENDSILSLERFLHIIADNHPSVKQVNLLYRQAEAELLAAKGGFDPKIYLFY